MKVIVQRSKKASVSVDGQIVGAIEKGFVLLVGIAQEDTEQDLIMLAKKIVQLRVFEDEQRKMNVSLKDISGSILSISQFTLLADTKKGNRPSFTKAANPQKAKDYYEKFNQQLINLGVPVETGIFGADMQVSLINDGPVTIIYDTHQSKLDE